MTEINNETLKLRTVRSFVRRQGRMTAAQQYGLTEYWPLYGLEVKNEYLSYKNIFHNEASVILDIGFGMGESLLKLAQHYTDINFIGVEVHKPGVGSLLTNIHKTDLKNVRVFCEDVNNVLKQVIPDHSLSGILIFFPDPWHKKRHHKRRLIQPDFISLILTKLQPKAIIHIATDWEDYALQIQSVMSSFNSLSPTTASLVQRPVTKYAQRGKRLGHNEWDLIYQLK